MLLTSPCATTTPKTTSRLRKRLDDGLRAVEVPILRADGSRLRLPRRSSSGTSSPSSSTVATRDGTPAAFCVATSSRSRSQGLRLVSDEDVAAGTEPRIHARAQPLLELRVERERVAGHEAVEPSAPLLADASRLHSGGSGADPLALVDDDAPGVAFREMERDGEAGDPGADDRYVAGQ